MREKKEDFLIASHHSMRNNSGAVLTFKLFLKLFQKNEPCIWRVLRGILKRGKSERRKEKRERSYLSRKAPDILPNSSFYDISFLKFSKKWKYRSSNFDSFTRLSYHSIFSSNPKKHLRPFYFLLGSKGRFLSGKYRSLLAHGCLS